MAKGNFRGYLKGERVRTKKYLYVLRPVLACQWIENEVGPPPMVFELLLDRLLPSGILRDAIDALLTKKRISAEVEDGPRVAVISDYLETELDRMQRSQPQLPMGSGNAQALDAFLRTTLAGLSG
jgi:predicted nucleotidyltransferase